MGKRKHSKKNDDEMVECLLKKVKKLVKRRRRRISSSSSEDDHSIKSPTQSPELTLDLEQEDEAPLNEIPLVELDTEENENLDPEILELLGSDPTINKNKSQELHKDVCVRWKHILLNGLPKEEKTNLVSQYIPPDNCTEIKAPKLNIEIKTALSETSLKKDNYSEQKQNQMTSCIAAIGQALNITLLNKENMPPELIKILGDTGRLLCDTHYRESQSRRFSIINSISKQKRDIIKNTKIDEYLFGSDLPEHIKTSKAISRSASELKLNPISKFNQQQFAQPSTSMPRRTETLNARGAPRIAAEPRVYPGQPRRLPPPPPPPPTRGRRREPNNTRGTGYRHQNRRR